MRTIPDYIKIAANAVEQIKRESGRKKVARPEKHILSALCEALHKIVMAFIPLRIFKDNNNLNTRDYTLYLQYVLPQLVTDAELQTYFLELLVRQHNNAESWTRPGLKKDFKNIVGLEFYNDSNDARSEVRMMPSRYHWIMCTYMYTYKELYTFDLRYPQDLVHEVERCFTEMIPMPHTYKMYADLYLGMRGAPYLDFLAKLLYLRYGDARMEAYLDAVIKQYIAALGTYHDGQANFQDIIHYVFGCRYARTAFEMGPYKARTYSLDTPDYRFKTILLRSAWPYTYANHASCRESVYTMMRLSEQEKQEYDEKYFGKRVRWNMASRTKIIVDHNNLDLPHRSTYDEIKALVKRYYTLNVLPKRLIPKRYVALKEIVLMSASTSTVAKDIKYMAYNTSLAPVLYVLMDEQENLLRIRYAQSNREEIITDKDVVHIYFYNKGRYQYRSIDYTVINSSDFRREAKMYCRKVLGEKVSVSLSNIQKVKKCIQFMVEMNTSFRVQRCRDVTAGHICIWLHRRQCDGIKPSTITEDLYTIRNLMDTIMGYKDYALKPGKNPAQHLHFFGAHDHIKNRPIIPDDILIFLDDHAWELDEEWRLIYRILRATSWRFDDVANLRVDGVYDIGDAEYFGIRTEISKTRKRRRMNGLEDYIEDVISAELYHALQDYIVSTDAVRKMYDTDYIFFSCYGGLPHQDNTHTFNVAINELLKRHGIKSIDSTYTTFSSAQTRATGATELIEAGVDLPIVQYKLGHLNPETTAKHYAHVREKRRGELDKEFFDQKFANLFEPEKLALLTEKERAALYENFVLGDRKVELGSCKKEPCGGACLRHGSTECVECTKLLTGPQNLSAWQEYLANSERRLKEMIAAYDARGISQDIYAEFKEYKETVRRRNAFQDVITKITSWKEGRE